MKPKKAEKSAQNEHVDSKPQSKLVVVMVVLTLLTLTLGTCAWLWHVEWLRPWLTSVGAALVALLGPIPGLLSPESRSKWLTLVVLAALIGAGTWYASKDAEQERDDARHKEQFFESLLKQLPPNAQDEFCKGARWELRQLVLDHGYQELKRKTTILQAFCPTNGYVLYAAGEAYRGLADYGDMLTAFRSYLFNADKDPTEAYTGVDTDLYDRASGYHAQRTAWIEHLMANYFFKKAQGPSGSDKIDDLEQVVAHERYMFRSRKIGFHADATTLDSVALLRQAGEQLLTVGQAPDEALLLVSQIEDERRKAAARPSGP